MSWQWRRRRGLLGGLVAFSLSRRGVGASVGAGPLRWSLGADGKVRRTVRAGGMWETRVVRRRPDDDPGRVRQRRVGNALVVGLVVTLVAVVVLML